MSKKLVQVFTVIVDECFGFQYRTFKSIDKAREYADQCEAGNFKALILKGKPKDWLAPGEKGNLQPYDE